MFGKLKEFLAKNLSVKIVTSIETPVFYGKLLEGKVAWIIGGNGGIGSAIAKAYTQNGCKVVISGTNKDSLESVCMEIGDGNAKYVIMDVKDIKNIDTSLKLAVSMFGKIDIFVYSSGVHCKDDFGAIRESTWDDVIDTNLKGMYFSCQAVGNYMISQKIHGHILTVSSASCTKPGWTPYEISKWGVRALTLGFSDKLIKYGIVVNSIAPGPVATKMLKGSCDDNLYWQGNPSGRLSTPAEVANLAVFEVSLMGDMIVGDTLFISGGSGTICLDK